jgi:hypothetical protein
MSRLGSLSWKRKVTFFVCPATLLVIIESKMT